MSANNDLIETVLVIQGPNLNLLGSREPEIYGHTTLNDIHASLVNQALSAKMTLRTFQSNHEGELIDRIHAAKKDTDFIIINPGAFTHTSVAMRDALIAIDVPFYEVHLSNIYKREAFRHHSYFSDIAIGVMCGFGPIGYQLALSAIIAKNNH
jgi:3-dehydroquinate dehydratase-2